MNARLKSLGIALVAMLAIGAVAASAASAQDLLTSDSENEKAVLTGTGTTKFTFEPSPHLEYTAKASHTPAHSPAKR